MTYEQSLKNIKAALNFISISDKDNIFFDFYNESEFKIFFFNITDVEMIRKLVASKCRANLPAVQITIEKDEHAHFLYYDSNLAYIFDITASELLLDDSHHDFIQQSPAQVKLQMAQLLAKLKQM